MTIGIEAERANNSQKTGVEHYTQQLILSLAKIDRKNNYILYLRTRPQKWFFSLPQNFSVQILAYGPLPFPYLWTQLRLSWEMLVRAPDALFVPAASLPLIHPRRSYITVHDIAWKRYPETFRILKRWYLEFTTWFACVFAEKIIAVSAATKKDLAEYYKVPPEKVVVVHHGFFLQQPAQAPARPGEAVPYIFFLSTLQPRKNLEGLITAFRQLKRELPELPHKLVVAGKPGWKYEPIMEAIKKNKDIVTYMSHVSEEEKAVLLSGASALVVPSFYEGFGMQLLEAFAAGVPVAASNVSSMPEVAGDAAVYFDPHDSAQIKNAIKNILLDKSLADRLRQKGTRRLAEFSWEKCAAETLEVMNRNGQN